MKFVKVKGKTTIVELEVLGFCNDDKVMVLFFFFCVLWGTLSWVTEYSNMFETQLTLDNIFNRVVDLASAVGMVKVELE